ncbi:capsule assembly protein Wzi [Gillisia mitskevichiae]|uniref:Capsule assembly protein Wzi n=1 Tax=Gillisia mitskevichiae TaxID=270921 RepID=A0A495PLJ2_9FLAO|nr:capsule assembly Wzi family protein [Gillisia mitskevichiae]RKS50565.1 capsule assembly protein Wzi [Gillisia mitskevichiae]
MKFSLTFLLILIGSFLLNAQQIKYEGTGSLAGVVYSQDESPFWIHSNQRGRIDEASNISAYFSGKATYQFSRHARLEVGLGGLFHDGYSEKLQLDESYIMLENYWLKAYLGRKQKDLLYDGLSASNQNILWSLNARPLAGASLSLKKPVTISKKAGISLDVTWEEFITDDERYVEDTRIHHKSFHLIFNKINNFGVKVGLQHFVQWGGNSPVFGKLPGSFGDYLDVFTGREGEDTVGGQEANALGNHLGSYEVYLTTSINDYNIEILYNHLFEDGSGRVLRNTPDGRYGLFVKSPYSDNIINSVMYEFYYTRDQSDDDITTDGNDNYFNNNLYRSGWTYESRILGVPFITLDDDRFRINNNKIIVHHIGISGVVGDLPYKLLSSYRRNYGAKGARNFKKSTILSSYLDLKVWRDSFDVNLQLGADINSKASPNFGAGVQISKKFF